MKMQFINRILLATFGLAMCGQVAAQEINNGDVVEIVVPGNSFVPSLFIDVGDARKLMEITISGAGDVDLLLLYEDEFPTTSDPGTLFSSADFYSGGLEGNEFVAIGRYNNPPLQGGRWRIGILNFNSTTTTVTLTASLRNNLGNSQIQVLYNMTEDDCDTAPWFDASGFTPEGGNNANTLGAARRAAFEAAIEIIAEQLISPVPILVQACWEDIEPQGGGVTLARAGPLSPIFSGLPGGETGTWYTRPAGLRLAGTDACGVLSSTNPQQNACGTPDLKATFNRLVDTNQALGGATWYYGFNIQTSTFDPDFVSTAAHELLHGFGFISTVDVETGAKLGPNVDDVFSLQLEDYNNGNPRNFMDITNTQRLNAITSRTDLRWQGFEGVNNDQNPFRLYQNGHPFMHAPAAVNPGSSVSHVSGEIFQGVPSYPSEELMRPIFLRASRELGIAQFMMWDAGWNPDAPGANVVIPDILVGNHYDRAFDGHGFELQRAGDTYFQLLYTYDALGNPEFYVAAGSLENGIFVADTMFRVVYNSANSPPQMPEPGSTGSSMIDFTVDSSDPACSDGTDRSDAIYLARWDWEIDSESGSWCIEPLLFASGTPSPNYTGSWYAGPSDDGWGLSIFHQSNNTASASDGDSKGNAEGNAKGNEETVLSAILYYYDSNGVGRWAIGSSDSFTSSNNTLTMLHVDGFCRDCPSSISGSVAGTLTLDLVDPSGAPGAGNMASMDVTFQGPDGGSWVRDNAPIQLLSSPVDQ